MVCQMFLPRRILVLSALLCILYVWTVTAFHPSVIPSRARGGSVYREALHRAGQLAGRRANTTANYYNQLIDHTHPFSGTFRQRWWVDLSAWDGRGAALLYIGGEGPETGSPQGAAQSFGASLKAAMFTLEHRFYGDSLPAPLTNRTMLRYLTVENALADLRGFKRYAEEHVLGRRVRWLLVGGSYPGALSAWARETYPDDFHAAWSSSGVVNLIFDYSAFDGHLLDVLSPACAAAIGAVFEAFSVAYDDPSRREAMMREFGTPNYFTKADMAWMLADGSAMAVQYGKKDDLCGSILPVNRSDPFSRYIGLIKELWGSDFTSNCYYSTECLSNTAYSAQWVNGYAWVYQCCAQAAFWQTSYPGSLRLDDITTSYFMNQCRAAFGPNIMPDTFAFNKKYGGATPNATRVVATQGSDDPWLPAGVTRTLRSDYVEFTAQCSGCGHCGDLGTPSDADSTAVREQRVAVFTKLREWMESE